MAQQDSGEKTQEPTHEKLRKAREKGQVAKSRDFILALSFVGACAVLLLSLSWMGQQLQSFMVEVFTAVASPHTSQVIGPLMFKGLLLLLGVSLPIVLTVMILDFAGNYFQIGLLFTSEPLRFNLQKINPINGLKQLFKPTKAVETLKQVIKFFFVGYIVYATIREHFSSVVYTQNASLNQSLAVSAQIIQSIFMRVAIVFIVIGIADLFWQRFSFRRQMRMSHYEIKQEYKQSEGDPHTKGERKRLAHELILGANPKKIAQADAVITNPVHLAVAIQYNKEEHHAPLIIAKGAAQLAEQIKSIAREHDVPIIRNVPLAQSLHRLELEEEIPQELYEAVAEVLNFVYELKKHKG